MGDAQQPLARPDPEAICTRVAARVIEELSCIDIAPDSPQWTDLRQNDTNVGQLAVYRGRSGVERMVCSSLRLTDPALDSHMVAVFTEGDSLVPHLVVDAVVVGEQASFHVDLLPRVDLGTSLAYLDHCYAPLTDTREALDRDKRFTAGRSPLRQRAMMTPWMALYTVNPTHLDAAEGCIQRYVDHWSHLMRKGMPFTAQREARGEDVAARSRKQRHLIFSRDVDPVWSMLDRALGQEMVNVLLDALRGD